MAELVALPTQQVTEAELPLVSVIMPAFNEELVLRSNLDRTYEYLLSRRGRYLFELIVVDDGSTDATGAVADNFAQGRPEVRVIHHTVNGHLGRALRTGFSASRGDYVVTLDCDLTYATDHIDQLLEALVAHHAHVAVASAYMPGGQVSGVPAMRLALSRGANRYLSAAVHGRLHTLTCMVRAYDGELVRNLSLRCSGTDINTEIIYKAELLGARIVEIPAHLDWESATKDAPGRVSSLKVARSIGQYLRAGVLFRPNGLFALASAVGAVGALVAWLVVVALALNAALSGSGGIGARVALVEDATIGRHGGVILLAALLSAISLQLVGVAFVSRLCRRYFEELFELTTRATWNAHDVTLWDPSVEHAAEGPHEAERSGRPRATDELRSVGLR